MQPLSRVAEYRIICAVRGAGGRLEALGYSERGSAVMYDDTWTLEEARQAMERGERLYVVDPVTGEPTDLSAEAGAGVDDYLRELPDCGRGGCYEAL